MNGRMELQLEAVSGVLSATRVSPAGRIAVWSQVFPLWSALARQEIVRRLASEPAEMYELLQGRPPLWFVELEPLPVDMERNLHQTMGEDSVKKEVLWIEIQKGLAEQPLLLLKLRGFPKEELLQEVFASWGQSVDLSGDGLSARTGLAAELARLERKGPTLSTSEWLAAAAAEGSLHQPGPMFHDVEERVFPVEPVVAAATENWQALLPQTPKVQEGLSLIMHKVAKAAALKAQKAAEREK